MAANMRHKYSRAVLIEPSEFSQAIASDSEICYNSDFCERGHFVVSFICVSITTLWTTKNDSPSTKCTKAMHWTHTRYAKNDADTACESFGYMAKLFYRNADYKGRQTMFKEHLKELMEKQRQKEGNAKE